MTIAELIEILQEYPQHLELVLSADAEGNSYQKLRIVDTAMFLEDESEVYSKEELQEMEEEDSEIYDADEVVVFWP